VTRILGISGSLRRDSHNTNLLRAAAEAAGPDVELEVYDGLKEIPPYDEDDDLHPRPASVASLVDAIADADGVLFSTPEYNGGIPGTLKNAIDWVSRDDENPLDGKCVLLIGTSPGALGAVRGLWHARQPFEAQGAFVHIPSEEEVDQLLAVRTVLETHSAGLAASRATPDARLLEAQSCWR